MLIRFLLCSLMLVGQLTSQEETQLPEFTQSEKDAYTETLFAEIQKQEEFIHELMKQNISLGVISQLVKANEMLNVKKILVSNFQNAPSLQSSLVRETLLNVLRKDNISEADLSSLQDIVTLERQRLNLTPLATPLLEIPTITPGTSPATSTGTPTQNPELYPVIPIQTEQPQTPAPEVQPTSPSSTEPPTSTTPEIPTNPDLYPG